MQLPLSILPCTVMDPHIENTGLAGGGGGIRMIELTCSMRAGCTFLCPGGIMVKAVLRGFGTKSEVGKFKVSHTF